MQEHEIKNLEAWASYKYAKAMSLEPPLLAVRQDNKL